MGRDGEGVKERVSPQEWWTESKCARPWEMMKMLVKL
jgi:hypothetical protein